MLSALFWVLGFPKPPPEPPKKLPITGLNANEKEIYEKLVGGLISGASPRFFDPKAGSWTGKVSQYVNHSEIDTATSKFQEVFQADKPRTFIINFKQRPPNNLSVDESTRSSEYRDDFDLINYVSSVEEYAGYKAVYIIRENKLGYVPHYLGTQPTSTDKKETNQNQAKKCVYALELGIAEAIYQNEGKWETVDKQTRKQCPQAEKIHALVIQVLERANKDIETLNDKYGYRENQADIIDTRLKPAASLRQRTI